MYGVDVGSLEMDMQPWPLEMAGKTLESLVYDTQGGSQDIPRVSETTQLYPSQHPGASSAGNGLDGFLTEPPTWIFSPITSQIANICQRRNHANSASPFALDLDNMDVGIIGTETTNDSSSFTASSSQPPLSLPQIPTRNCGKWRYVHLSDQDPWRNATC
jgi:hypothetical protein